ncbi:hypothetical protein [Spirosoma agri]|uniref:Uncharacterized protein n=1 Tax=Spirosoma agri TaxID=1987381 RepID=A0A6M0IJ40_9BACT|nr:hypothetical protein [Spirosoma agri]NEU68278.1 hypothetical protein [Spirosoma agri]
MAQQIRGTEPPGYIHLPKLGLVATSDIGYFVSQKQYCHIYFVGSNRPHLLSEPLAYFRRKLPHFVETRFHNCQGLRIRRKLYNPALPAINGLREA